MDYKHRARGRSRVLRESLYDIDGVSSDRRPSHLLRLSKKLAKAVSVIAPIILTNDVCSLKPVSSMHSILASASLCYTAFTVFLKCCETLVWLWVNRLYFSSHFLFSYGKVQVWTSSTMPWPRSMDFTSCLAVKACRGSFVTDSRILGFTGKGFPCRG